MFHMGMFLKNGIYIWLVTKKDEIRRRKRKKENSQEKGKRVVLKMFKLNGKRGD